MVDRITLDSLRGHLEFFNKMYDAVRLVDPVKKQVTECKGCKFDDKSGSCYEYWKNAKICDNCISIRSYQEDKSFMKLEQGKDNIMMVTAIPLENMEKPTVLELLKDVTHSMMLGSGDYNEGKMMYDVISKLNDMIVKDALTSVYNRRFVDERLGVDIIKATIMDIPLSVVFMDVDNLKDINDIYGHAVGDDVLKEVGRVVRKCIRSHSDWVARYGGDEFLICLNDTDEKNAIMICNRIKKAIEQVQIPDLDNDIQISLSMGVYTMQDEELTPEEIIRYADEKMYESKRDKRRM
ncbi:GGDEF domain-containing protein [Tissierellaceae bacterium HCP3S3_D8]